MVKMRAAPPRAFQIRKEDAEKHGYARGCPGCSSWFRGLGRQPHSETCRSRFEELLKGEVRFQNAERKRKEFEEKMKEKAAKKSRKEESRGRMKKRGSADQGTPGTRWRWPGLRVLGTS